MPFFTFGSGFGFGRGNQVIYEDLLPSLSFGLSTYDYGEHDTGTNTDYIFTLTNSGNELAEDITVVVTGTGYSLLSSAGPFNIAADGGYASITVRFTPASSGALSGALTVSWPNQDDITVTLAGTGVATSVTLIVDDDFEGTGTPAGWTTNGTDFNFDDTTAPVLSGTQQLKMAGNDGTSFVSRTYTSSSEIWGRFICNLSAVSADPVFLYVRNGSYDMQFYVRATFNKLRICVGSVTADTVSTFSAATKYYVWFHYKEGSGANAEGSVAFSTDGIMPTSGNNYASLNTGTAVDPAVTAQFYNISGMVGLYDDLKISAEGPIGDA